MMRCWTCSGSANPDPDCNHEHLGKLLTYLSVYDAEAAIWVVENPRVEHVDAIAWLSQSSSADFYMVKVEAVRIGNSDFAPLLTLIVGPSEESNEIAEEKEQIAQRFVERKIFWKGLLDLEVANKKHHCTRESFSHKGQLAASGIGQERKSSLPITIRERDVQVEVWIESGDEAKLVFDKFFAKKAEVERSFGEALEWQRLEQKKGCRNELCLPSVAIVIRTSGANYLSGWQTRWLHLNGRFVLTLTLCAPNVNRVNFFVD
jgi:Domain of unknown function (DUF4268)